MKKEFYFIPVLFSGEGVEPPRVVNVFIPEHRSYFMQHLGYFLATFLLLGFIVIALIMLTRRRKKRGIFYYNIPAWLLLVYCNLIVFLSIIKSIFIRVTFCYYCVRLSFFFCFLQGWSMSWVDPNGNALSCG